MKVTLKATSEKGNNMVLVDLVIEGKARAYAIGNERECCRDFISLPNDLQAHTASSEREAYRFSIKRDNGDIGEALKKLVDSIVKNNKNYFDRLPAVDMIIENTLQE